MDEQREQNGAEGSAAQSEDVSEIDMSVPEHGSKVCWDEATDDRLQLRKTEAETGIALEMGINGGDRRSLGPVVDGHDGTLQFVGGGVLLPELEHSDIMLCLENHFRISPLELRKLIL